MERGAQSGSPCVVVTRMASLQRRARRRQSAERCHHGAMLQLAELRSTLVRASLPWIPMFLSSLARLAISPSARRPPPRTLTLTLAPQEGTSFLL